VPTTQLNSLIDNDSKKLDRIGLIMSIVGWSVMFILFIIIGFTKAYPFFMFMLLLCPIASVIGGYFMIRSFNNQINKFGLGSMIAGGILIPFFFIGLFVSSV
jgi:hypothetical protein